jgi:uncharacterized ferredoxin-like protein
MITDINQIENSAKHIAESMVVAAITAPKARGVSNMFTGILEKNEIKAVSDHLIKMVEERNFPPFFKRDAMNILSAQCVFIIGTRIKSTGIPACGLCGFKDCAEKDLHPDQPCSFNTGDLGIAIGSAVSIAADHRADCRVMFTVGKAVVEMGLLGEDVRIAHGIPISVSSKNPFFDR